MSIQVPLFSKSLSQIQRPLPPSDPPTSQDIVHAIVLLEKAKEFLAPPHSRENCAGTTVWPLLTTLRKRSCIYTRKLDQMNETLVRVMDNSRIHPLEQRLDSDSQLYHQIPISWDFGAQDPEHFELPPLRTNNDFTNLTDYQLDDYYYRIDIDDQSTRETKIHCLRYYIIFRLTSNRTNFTRVLNISTCLVLTSMDGNETGLFEINFALHAEIVLSFDFEKECFRSLSSLTKHAASPSTVAMEGVNEENVGVVFWGTRVSDEKKLEVAYVE
ncbi:uncharacterized protein F5891DRAFT_987604 [Suillus fuscotomentosus]|uniref:Mug135-like C-terminal domain-containing protein n=1 Tax=Suillus fuscotomentosus TaxID=1912939 RepID=A0AAD4DPX7_9AGAM|nr:uncharacterized protein F5891DRAFT_987604 [Suillus fuscotomentosus]KAG1888997.1 hypothetical protein F5891DRAFT_987604 [Suillus fuscotomentosus]